MKEEILGLLEQMALKLGTTTEYLWEILVKQAVVDGIISISFFLFTLITTIIVVSVHLKLSKKDKYHTSDYDLSGIMIFTTIVNSILLIIGLVSLFCGIETLLNPEYFAFREVIRIFK